MQYKKLWSLLSKPERKETIVLLAMILVMSLLDVVGVASILPFITILGSPELVETNAVLSWAYSYFEFTSITDFFFFLGGLVFVTLLISLSWKTVTQYKLLSFVFMREHSIGVRMFEGYLNQPYAWFLDRNSSELGKNLLSELRELLSKMLLPAINLISQGTVSLLMLIMLLIVDYKLAITVSVVLGLFYGLIYTSISRLLSRMGAKRYDSNSDRFRVASESLFAIKEVKIGGVEGLYIKRFNSSAKEFAKNEAQLKTITALPRYALEAIAFGGMVLVLLSVLDNENDVSKVLPIVALYAFAGYRLLPAMQMVYSNITSLRFSETIINEFHKEISSLGEVSKKNKKEIMPLKDNITLTNVSFNYPGTDTKVLNDVSLAIPANSMVGLVGLTGSGKTTLVDIVLGLLEPQSGSLTVDGVEIELKNVNNWQSNLGYVPQQISLLDASLAENIAFGVKIDEISMETVKKVSTIACLHDFVNNNLEDGYNTAIGERGVKLSGGQRQRVGLARALYHNPSVLVLDEATSALDNTTERFVMDSIKKLGHDITIIIIAHRLSTIRDCDVIYHLAKGDILSKGTYEELLDNDKKFSEMVAHEDREK
ncbi:ABC transporter ATP-binding protein/permease [Gammaproteobacteria bacterium]|nr:ABC transporter ATP-binding protein/permease [Gammaproteobacteria bacterium]